MGAYLSAPATDKISSDQVADRLSVGASSMQGWRVSQEDAHNSCPDYDEDTNTALFGVYDGHGGAEVAQYMAMKFPDYLKSSQLYKSGNLPQALEDAFLGFDHSIIQEEVIVQLKELAGMEEADEEEEDLYASKTDERSGKTGSEAELLNEEATMPLEQLLQRFGGADNKTVNILKKQENKQSPNLKSKKEVGQGDGPDNAVAASQQIPDSSGGGDGIEKPLKNVVNGQDDLCNEAKSTNGQHVSSNETKEDKSLDKNECTSTSSIIQNSAPAGSSSCSSSSSSDPKEADSSNDKTKTDLSQSEGSSSGVSSTADSTGSKVGNSESGGSSAVSSGVGSSGGSGSSSSSAVGSSADSSGPIEEADDSSIEDSDDSDVDVDLGELHGSESEESEEEMDEADDMDEEDCMSAGEEPGSDSGCTAVVAVLRDNELHVANAGDSRCVLCRDGKAIEMSLDHKPEDEIEKNRIHKAGGRITMDGRVNGGLNLSRAIGDHCYKQNSVLPLKEQMISPLPDIKSITLEEKDEFMIMACDGIWNVLSSQDVVNFVRERLQGGAEKLSAICEELFDYCLAPDTTGDGTGCDNMTCMIIKFNEKTFLNNHLKGAKRQRTEEENTEQNKKAKNENTVEPASSDTPAEKPTDLKEESNKETNVTPPSEDSEKTAV